VSITRISPQGLTSSSPSSPAGTLPEANVLPLPDQKQGIARTMFSPRGVMVRNMDCVIPADLFKKRHGVEFFRTNPISKESNDEKELERLSKIYLSGKEREHKEELRKKVLDDKIQQIQKFQQDNPHLSEEETKERIAEVADLTDKMARQRMEEMCTQLSEISGPNPPSFVYQSFFDFKSLEERHRQNIVKIEQIDRHRMDLWSFKNMPQAESQDKTLEGMWQNLCKDLKLTNWENDEYGVYEMDPRHKALARKTFELEADRERAIFFNGAIQKRVDHTIQKVAEELAKNCAQARVL